MNPRNACPPLRQRVQQTHLGSTVGELLVVSGCKAQEGLGCCPARGIWDFSPLPTGKGFSPHLLSVSHRHTGPTAFKPPFATGTLEQCILGLVGMRDAARRDGRSSCGPGPAPLDGRSEPQVLQITLFSCLSRARFLLLVLCLLATSGH